MQSPDHNYWNSFLLIMGMAALIVMSAMFWMRRRKIKSRTFTTNIPRVVEKPEAEQQGEQTSEQDSAIALEASDEVDPAVPEPPKPRKAIVAEPSQLCDSLADSARSCLDPKLREFMEGIVARIREEAYSIGEDMSIDLIEELVDRVDELKLIASKDSEPEAVAASEFREGVVTLLGTSDVELLHSESWNPYIQRALSKIPTTGISKPIITSFVSTGFSRSSKLIRKQEVILAVPLQP